MKRLFLAIPINIKTSPASELANNLRQRLKHETFVNWVQLNNVHLTLKFIGNTFPQDELRIIDAMNEVFGRHQAFDMVFDNVGVFGSRYAPRVVWLGMRNTPQQLISLADDVLDTFDRIGFPKDRQNFVPHLTLARIKNLYDKEYFTKTIQSIEQKPYISQTVNEIILFQSILRPEGAIYKVVKSWHI